MQGDNDESAANSNGSEKGSRLGLHFSERSAEKSSGFCRITPFVQLSAFIQPSAKNQTASLSRRQRSSASRIKLFDVISIDRAVGLLDQRLPSIGRAAQSFVLAQ